ncbi:hypothetical protein KW787_01935 [Candidatus Pacearchaeota archaeon]|nr:hypothetical protein [Candidatus Pacearchaeota archaeon]
MARKAQAWGLDLIIAGVIFTSALVVLYLYGLNYSNEGEDTLKALQYDGDTMSSLILSDGVPLDWNATQVVIPGILTDNKINSTKLEYFYDLSSNDYSIARSLLGTKYNYFMFLSTPMIVHGQTVSGIGLNATNPNNLITITRFTSYQNKIATLYLQLWN